MADLRHDFVRTINTPLDTLDMGHLAEVLREQAKVGKALIEAENVDMFSMQQSYVLDMQFVGQTHLLRVPLDGPDITRETLRAKFDEVYFRRFKVRLDNVRAMVVNANCSVVGTRAALDLSRLIDPAGRKARLVEAQTGSRKVYFDGAWHETPIYWRDHLPEGFHLTGPAVVEQMDTTVLIEPGDHATGDADGNIIITLGVRP